MKSPYSQPNYFPLFLMACLSWMGGLTLAFGEDNPRELIPFTFSDVELLPVDDAVVLLMNLGYGGIVPQGRTTAEIDRLAEFLDHPSVVSGEFKIYAYYVNHKAFQIGYDASVQKQIIDVLAARGGGTIWMTVRAKQDQSIITQQDFDNTNALVQEIFDYATGYDNQGNYRNVNIVYYPHVNNTYETTIEAMSLVKLINDPRFTVAINLIHESNAGRIDLVSLQETFEAARGHIGAVNVTGIDLADPGPGIVSLHNSTYDLTEFMGLVRDSEYRGSIGYLNFAIPEDLNDGLPYPEDYLTASISEWELLSAEASLYHVPTQPLMLHIALDASGFSFRWKSELGKFYDLLSSTDLNNWAVHEDGDTVYSNMATSGLGENTLSGMSFGGETRFFILRQKINTEL